jgi:hypothetical protein
MALCAAVNLVIEAVLFHRPDRVAVDGAVLGVLLVFAAWRILSAVRLFRRCRGRDEPRAGRRGPAG